MARDIPLSPKHGLNVGLEQCFYCGEDVGVILFGKLPGDAEAPRRACLNHTPCDKCKGFMEQGVILISVDEARTDDPKNPWRTGGWVVMRDEYITRTFQPQELVDSVLKKRVAFVPDDAWDMLGLPRGTEKTSG